MWSVLRLTVVVVVVLLSAGPRSGAWYPPELYNAGWLQYGGGLWPFLAFQQQQLYLLKMQVNPLKLQTSQQQEEVNQLKPLQEKVALLETILGVNLTADGANLTDFGPSIIQRLTTVEDQQKDILAQPETFQQQHELYNASMQSLSDQLESLEAVVNLNTGNITAIHATLDEHAQHRVQLDEHEQVLTNRTNQLLSHSEQLLSLLEKVQAHASIINGSLNDSAALANRLASIQVESENYNVTLIANNVTLQGLERRLERHTDQLNADAQEISDIEHRVTSVESALQLLNQTKQAVFSVRCSSCPEVNGRDNVIMYDDVETNIGSRYSTETGCFDAEYNGLYVFFADLHSDNTTNITVAISQDETFRMEVTADGGVHPWNSGSALLTTRLAAGNRVCVKYVRGDNSFDSSSFSGWLVDADR